MNLWGLSKDSKSNIVCVEIQYTEFQEQLQSHLQLLIKQFSPESIRNQKLLLVSYSNRKTHCDSDKANNQQQAVCQAEQITTVEADR